MNEKLQYPIGKYEPQPFSEELKIKRLKEIEQLPHNLERAIQGLTEAQLQTPYRDGGWTVRQVVHHIADTDVNLYIRVRKALVEQNPVLSTFDGNLWLGLADTQIVHPQVSIDLVKALNTRLVAVFGNLKADDWNKTIHYSNKKIDVIVWYLLGMYLWHNRHHTAHITSLRERMGW